MAEYLIRLENTVFIIEGFQLITMAMLVYVIFKLKGKANA